MLDDYLLGYDFGRHPNIGMHSRFLNESPIPYDTQVIEQAEMQLNNVQKPYAEARTPPEPSKVLLARVVPINFGSDYNFMK